VNDDSNAGTARIPKYKAADFMRKEMALFMNARMETLLNRRNGDTDTPIQPIVPLSAVRAVRQIRGIPGIDTDA
jgi:hypothetical protein